MFVKCIVPYYKGELQWILAGYEAQLQTIVIQRCMEILLKINIKDYSLEKFPHQKKNPQHFLIGQSPNPTISI